MGCTQSSPSQGVSSLGQEASTPPEAGNEKEETPLQPFEQKHAEPAADVVKNLQSEVVPIEASDGLDDELEREMQRIIQGTDGLERDNHESKSIKQSGDAKTKLRERTNTIQNDKTADESRRDGEDGRHSKYVHITNDKENVSQGEVVSTVARRSSILQLIGDSNFDDDSDLDESSGEDDQAGSARMPVGNGKVSVRSEYRGAGNTDARKVISLENEYQTTAMDTLYNAREPHEMQNGLADRHEPDPLNARVMSLDDSLEVTDVDDPFSRDTITRDFSAEPLAGTNESSNAHTMIDSIGSHNNTSHDGSSYAIQTGSFAMDTFVEQGNEVHTIETLEMGDTLGDGFESNQGGTDEVSMMETFDTMSTNRRPADLDSVPSSSVGATVMYDHEDKLADGAITEGGGTAIPIDTCDLTEEDKVWRSLTNQYASINSNGSIETNTIDTHHTLISQDTTTMETHHTLSQATNSGPQTLEEDMDDSATFSRKGGWEGDFAMTGTLMMGNDQLGSLPETDELESQEGTYGGVQSSRGRLGHIMDAGDLILEDDFD